MQPLVYLPHTITERPGTVFGHALLRPTDNDLTAQHPGQPLGERMLVQRRVQDEDARPVRRALIEVWQANAAGRYRHKVDQHDAPLDPTSAGRAASSSTTGVSTNLEPSGRVPIRGATTTTPGDRSISTLALRADILSRLVTQMYFPGDPLHALDPIFNGIADANA